MRVIVESLVALWLGAAGQAAAAPYPIAPVRPALETPGLPDNAFESDADDRAIWVHPTTPRRSLVVTAVKDGGIRVYDPTGELVQTIDPVSSDAGKGRINNVDVAYGLKLPGGGRIDVAVATARWWSSSSATFGSPPSMTARTCGPRTTTTRCSTGARSSRDWSSTSAAGSSTRARRMSASGA
jgi:Phytase